MSRRDFNSQYNYSNSNSGHNRYASRSEAYIIRTEQVRLQKRILMIFCFVFILTTLLLSAKTYAGSNKPSGNANKLYKSVLIYSGDTLESIAEEYMTDEYSSVHKYICEVASINGFSTDTKLTPGNHIIVPYYEDAGQPSVIVFNLSCNWPAILDVIFYTHLFTPGYFNSFKPGVPLLLNIFFI